MSLQVVAMRDLPYETGVEKLSDGIKTISKAERK